MVKEQEIIIIIMDYLKILNFLCIIDLTLGLFWILGNDLKRIIKTDYHLEIDIIFIFWTIILPFWIFTIIVFIGETLMKINMDYLEIYSISVILAMLIVIKFFKL